MPNASQFSIDLMHKLAITAARAGAESQDFTDLVQSEELFHRVLAMVRGNHVINLDAIPLIPKGWSIKPEDQIPGQRRTGLWKWRKEQVKLSLPAYRGGINWIRDEKFKDNLENKPILNANVLDYLLANPILIPAEWKGAPVFFWGTIYRDSAGSPCVRYLNWSRKGWWSWEHDLVGWNLSFASSVALFVN